MGKFLSIIALLFITYCSYSQTPPLYNLSAADGLPSSNIYRIAQDNRGFLWIATENGLCRYDGSEIKTLDTRDGLPDNSVIHVSMDFDNHLWVCTYNIGMCLLKDEELITSGDSLKLAAEQITKIAHTRNSVWLVSSRRWLYSIINGKQRLLRLANGDTAMCQSIVPVNDTTVLFLLQDGLYSYTDKGGYKPINYPAIKGAQMFFPFEKKLLALCDEHIFLLDESQRIERTIPLEKKHVWNDVVTDSRGNIWMASGSELMKLAGNGEFLRYKKFFKTTPLFINDLFVDSWDNIWVATYGAGLYCIWNKDITYLPVTPGKINHNVTALQSYEEDVYISSLGGTLARWNKGEITPVSLPCNTLNDYVYFNIARPDTLIMGKNSGLCYVTKNREKQPVCSCVPYRGGAISGLIDSRGYLWVGHYNGVSFHNGEYSVWLNKKEMAQRRVNAIYEYPAGTFYFGTDLGLFIYANDTIKPVFVSSQSDARFVTSLQVDKTGNLWIGTRGGLFIRHNGQENIQRYNHLLLSRTKISQFIETPDGAVWSASDQGVYRYNGKEFIAFTRQNGLISNHVLSITIDNKKRLWAGTPDGISVIGTERHDKELEVIPRLYITDVRYEQAIEKYPKRVSVYSDVKNIIINFTAIIFPVSSHIKFEYRIKGHTEDWQQLPNRSLILSSLPHGSYRIEIRTSGASPQDKPEYAYLDINVLPLFYEKSFFWVAVAAILILLIVLLVNYRIRNIRKRERARNWRKLRTLYLRLQSVQASLNPHFIFNSLNSILSLVKTQRNEQAEHYLTGFSKLLRSTLQSSANTAITIEKEVERLNQYLALEKIRFAGSFDYKINMDENLDAGHIKIPVMIVQPFVENALKHGIRQANGKEGYICVNFVMIDRSLKIEIEDNGIGYYTSLKAKETTGHRSLGIQMVQKQLTLLNEAGLGTYSLSIKEKSPGLGTVVEILLPLN